MRKFKIIDVWINILLIVIFSIVTWISRDNYRMAVLSYFIVGGWQIISMLVHILHPTFKITTARSIYQYTLIIVTVLVLLSIPFDMVLLALYLLLIVSPFMAIYYTYVCYRETYVKMKRPMDQLK